MIIVLKKEILGSIIDTVFLYNLYISTLNEKNAFKMNENILFQFPFEYKFIVLYYIPRVILLQVCYINWNPELSWRTFRFLFPLQIIDYIRKQYQLLILIFLSGLNNQ
jgi:hypothetical protein